MRIKYAVVAAFLAAMLLMLAPCAFAQDDNDKPRLSLQSMFMGGFLSPSPGQFMWMPDSGSFLYQYMGAYQEFDIATGESAKAFTNGELRKALMEGRESRADQGMGNENATGRFNRSALTMSPDGTMLAGVMDNDLYVYSLAEGTPRWVTDDLAVEQFQAFSPDNSKIAYVKNNEIFVFDLATNTETQITSSGHDEIWNGVADWVYEEELSVQRAFWWSPGSDKIAYLRFDTRPVKTFYIIDHLQQRPVLEEQKFPHAGEENSTVTLGIADLTGNTTWVDVGGSDDYYIYQADWSASGDFLTYRWMNRPQNRIELRAANPETGESTVLVVEESDTWVNAKSGWLTKTEMLHFFEDDSFLWLSERSGWFHIYHFDKDGALIRQLTEGEWMVDTLDAVTDTHVVFTGRKESPLEKHLYQVPLGGGEIVKLTPEAGMHNCSVSPDGTYFISSHSSIKTPPQVRVFKTDGELLATLKSNENPAMKNFNFNFTELGEVTAEDGTVLYTAMTLPPDFDENKKYPVMVYVYGGPGVQTVTNGWNFGLIIYHQLFAARDYIVFTLDNRGSFGRGHAFEAAVYKRLGTLELDDQLVGVNWLKTLPYVDAENIGITGGSYGGYMTLLGLFKAPDVFKAGASQFPGVNWENYDTIYTERYMSTPEDNPEGYKEADAANFAQNLKGHLLITQGMMDNNVHMQETVHLIEALIKAGKEYRMYFYPRERHGIGAPHRFMHSEKVISTFLDRHLKGEQ